MCRIWFFGVRFWFLGLVVVVFEEVDSNDSIKR